ncbi:MAG: D-xylose ABC transporter ATP-binding protein [Cereibacter sphaeroides]|uniref:D-xylose ABC transporter ATP-binding protein n=1 Tax=Cereibacter sphaeroides TaxID=1063 RepID=A0A2W5UCW1_CERSP|nr:MAG: D-xylose ABC transporter ATP-binding protein [Cereibacter sphaeroides]
MPGLHLKLRDITKVYPGSVALSHVSLDVTGGEIVGLVGENGAGKSTLLKILGGNVAPTMGEIAIDDQTLPELSPSLAQSLGIAFVHQELNSFSNLDVTANILLGRERTRGRFGALDRRAMRDAVRPILDLIGARFQPDTPVSDLSLADLQLLEICRALSLNARLIILDEPTSSLSIRESERLLDIMRDLRARGVALLFVSHRLSEVIACADRVVVLRDGRNSGSLGAGELTQEAITSRMIGRDLQKARVAPHAGSGEVVLAIQGMGTAAFPTASATLNIRAGEIHGLAGLVGAGRTELARAVFGIDHPVSGKASLDGSTLPIDDVGEVVRRGLCLVPEDRKVEGLFLDFSIAENISLPNLTEVARHGLVDSKEEQALAQTSRQRFGIRANSVEQAAAELSGGNQQKVVLAKWLARRPRALILDEPTRGIDVGAKAEIYGLMRKLAADGVAILMISSDMEEIIGVCDCVSVMRRGEITGTLTDDAITEHNILDLAVG